MLFFYIANCSRSEATACANAAAAAAAANILIADKYSHIYYAQLNNNIIEKGEITKNLHFTRNSLGHSGGTNMGSLDMKVISKTEPFETGDFKRLIS